MFRFNVVLGSNLEPVIVTVVGSYSFVNETVFSMLELAFNNS